MKKLYGIECYSTTTRESKIIDIVFTNRAKVVNYIRILKAQNDVWYDVYNIIELKVR